MARDRTKAADAPDREPSQGEPIELALFTGDTLLVKPLPESGVVTIGRGEDCTIRVDHPSVSRAHAALHIGPRILVEDLGSANATRVADRSELTLSGETLDLRTIRGGPTEIAIGDTLTMGGVMVVVRAAARPIAPPPSARGPQREHDHTGAVVADPAMQRLYEQIDRVAPTFLGVLVLGETGTGKEIVARAIHERSDRARGPFVAINCGALSATLVESELFGYEASAFTGARQARPGLIETAHGGTVLLDEIGDLPLEMQVKLLRVLQERKVTRVGGRAARDVDVRFVAATNRDLEAQVAAGAFREDLLFRINGVTLDIPPLRQRPSEIAVLARLFVAEACRQLRRSWRPSLPEDTLRILREYRWPGNIRELKNEIDRAVVLCAGDKLSPEHFHQKLLRRDSQTPPAVGTKPPPPLALPTDVPTAAAGTTPASPASSDAGEASIAELEARLKAAERRRIVEALAQTGGHQKRAAALLGVSLRTFVNRLTEHDIPRPRVKRVLGG